ncbi:MAG: gamma-glutamyltransferase family protein [Spirochaetales bacterium]|nr:gamma-glutamyltransferase family protein [Spirochaetales bacterium]
MNLLSSEQFISRRSPVVSTRGLVATSQPIATLTGVDILKGGGSAADAAVAAAAVLQVTQPCSTGLGGDCFVLYYCSERRSVEALDGSGRSPRALTAEMARSAGFVDRLPPYHPYTVTVPGAPAAWMDAHKRWGRLPIADILQPAIEIAERGFPVSPLTAGWWEERARRTLSRHRHGGELMIDGRGPRPGEVMRLPNLARTLRTLAERGRESFYSGEIAERIVAAVREAGGMINMSDLGEHESNWVDPIRIEYRGCHVWECPPSGHGLAALLALNILKMSDFDGLPAGGTDRFHLLVEAMRLAFADAGSYIGDPEFTDVPLSGLLSEEYAELRAKTISMKRAAESPLCGDPASFASAGGDTVYFCVVDTEGNACSFINSNYLGFGTGIVPEGCGYSLQNRGYGFVLESGHPNCLEPGKRPYHTIIPGLSTDAGTGLLHSAFGVMGGMMQPQGHLQILSALIDDGLDPQAALDRGRFQLEQGSPDGDLLVEDSLSEDLREGMKRRGHRLKVLSALERKTFGLGQIIVRDPDGVYWGGSDPRGDGCALGLY